jgi:hypothetical protein
MATPRPRSGPLQTVTVPDRADRRARRPAAQSGIPEVIEVDEQRRELLNYLHARHVLSLEIVARPTL